MATRTIKQRGKVYKIVAFPKTKAIADSYVKKNKGSALFGAENIVSFVIKKNDNGAGYLIYAHQKRSKQFQKDLDNLFKKK